MIRAVFIAGHDSMHAIKICFESRTPRWCARQRERARQVSSRVVEDDTFASIDEPMRKRLRAEVLRRLALLRPDELEWRRPLISVAAVRPASA
jgi:hypothetical protein